MPTSQPSSLPTSAPSNPPSIQPSTQPTSEPTSQPSCHPSFQSINRPSFQPANNPSNLPTLDPTRIPTLRPIFSPSRYPSIQPTRRPTAQPSKQPSGKFPSIQPSKLPRSLPTYQPITEPSRQPLKKPTSQPNKRPTSQPSSQPSFQPTKSPTSHPSFRSSPQPSRLPSCQPTRLPSIQPAVYPSSKPTMISSSKPTHKPSKNPTDSPTQFPTQIPTIQPSKIPLIIPTKLPSTFPSVQPIRRPSSQPKIYPSTQPIIIPSNQPSYQPGLKPSRQPTWSPSMQKLLSPTRQPQKKPSCQPRRKPSKQPVMYPTKAPSCKPTKQPISFPTRQPRKYPTFQPIRMPTCQPSRQPAPIPSTQPYCEPSNQPTLNPSCKPSIQPTKFPRRSPSRQPYISPSNQPSRQPRLRPTSQPTISPIRMPSFQPLKVPTVQPVSGPTVCPSLIPFQIPTAQPKRRPTQLPSVCPTNPTTQPSRQPLRKPSKQPRKGPSCQPTCQPLHYPTKQPYVQPTRHPSSQPSARPSKSTPTISFSPLKRPLRSTLVPSLLPTVTSTANDKQQWLSNLQMIRQYEKTNSPSIQRALNEYLYDNIVNIGGQNDFESFATSDIIYLMANNRMTSLTMSFKSSSPYVPDFERIYCNESSKSLEILQGFISLKHALPGYQITKTCAGHVWVFAKCLSLTVKLCVDCDDLCSYNNILADSVFPYPCGSTGGCIHSFIATFTDLYPAAAILHINASEVTQNSFNVSTVTMDKITPTYCVALPDKIQLSSVLTILQGQMIKIGGETLSSSLRFGNLKPSSKYRVYCTTLSFSGSVLSLSAVLDQSINVETLCCKTVSVKLFHRFVFPGKSYFNAILLSLSSMPSDTLQITVSTNQDGLVVSPQDIIFSTSSISATDSFYLSLYSSLGLDAGKYYLTISLQGTSANEYTVYYPTSEIINVIDSTFVGPPPAFSYATLDALGRGVLVGLSDSTNKNSLFDTFSCAKLLNFTGVENALCAWSDSSTVKISFPNICHLGVGDVISWSVDTLEVLQPTDVRLPSWPTNSRSDTIAIQYSPAVIIPSVVAVGPRYITSCVPLLIDLSSSEGSGGREWRKISVTITAANGEDTFPLTNYVQQQINNASTHVVVPQGYMDVVGLYNYFFTFCNWLGHCGSTCYQVTVTNTSFSSVTILGPQTRSMNAYDSLTLYSRISPKNCGNLTTPKLLIMWSVYQNDVTLPTIINESNDSNIFYVNSYSFTPGEMYEVGLSVHDVQRSLTTTVKIYLEIAEAKSSDLIAIISQGSEMSASVGQKMVLDASFSYDRTMSPSRRYSDTQLQYEWSCSIIPCDLALMPNGMHLQFIARATAASQILQIQLKISKNSFYATAYIRLKIEFKSAACTINISPIIQGVNVAKKLSLPGKGIAFGPSSLTWSLGNSIGLNLSTISMGAAHLIVNATQALNFTFPLALAAFSLPHSSSFTFQLTCTNSKTLISSYVQITVTTNSPPLYGSIRISPSSGYEMITIFMLEAKYWVSSELPLKYEFSFLSNYNNIFLPIGGISEAAFVYSVLPRGNSAQFFALSCSLLVLDSVDCSANASTSVTVIKSVASSKANFSAAPDVQNTDSMTQYLSIQSSLMNLVNCSASPNCQSLNRAPCFSVSHTCGECLSGYSGQPRSADSPCIASFPVASTSRRLAQNVPKTCNGTHQSIQCDPFDVCSKGVCQPGIRTCSLSCSGRGRCVWTNIYSGATMSKCMLSDFSCTASCVCSNGYYGSSCEYSNTQIQLRMSRRCSLITTFYEYLPYCNVDYNTVSYLVSILSSIIQKPQEISANCIRNAIIAINSVTAYSQSVGLPLETMERLSSSIDTIVAAILLNLGDLQNPLRDIVSLIQRFSVALSSDIIISQRKSLINDLFRMDMAVFFLSDKVQLSEPLTEIEKITEQHASQQYFYNPSHSSLEFQNMWVSSSFVVFEGAITGKADYLSSPLALITNFGSSPEALGRYYDSSVTIRTRNIYDLNSTQVYAPPSVTTKCYDDDYKSVTQQCPAGLKSAIAACRGREEELINACPTYHFQPHCDIFGSLPKSDDAKCILQSHSSTQSQCVCDAGSHAAVNASYYVLLSTSSVTVTNSNSSFSYAAISSSSSQQLSSASLGVLVVCIVLLMMSITIVIRHRTEIASASIIKKEKMDWYTTDLQSSWQKIGAADVFAVLHNQLLQVVPNIYVQKVTLASVLKEIFQNHTFWGMFVSSKVSPIMKFWRASTEMTAALLFTYIAVIVLYNPADQKLCKAMSNAKECLTTKSTFSHTLNICNWDNRSATCEENIAVNDALLLLILSFIVQLIMIPVSISVMVVVRRHVSKVTTLLKRTVHSRMDSLKFGAMKQISSLDESKYESYPVNASSDKEIPSSLFSFKAGKVAPLGTESRQSEVENLTTLSHIELNNIQDLSKSMRDNRLIYIFICDILSILGGVNVFQAKVESDNGMYMARFPTISVVIGVSAIDVALVVFIFQQISLLQNQAQVLWAFIFLTWLSVHMVIFNPCVLLMTEVLVPLTALERLKKVTLYLQRTARAYLILRFNPAKRLSTPLKSRMSSLFMMSVKVARLCSNTGCGSIISDLLQSFTGLESLMNKQLAEDKSSAGIDKLIRVFITGMEVLCSSALLLDTIVYVAITITVWGSIMLWIVIAVSDASITIVILIVALMLFILMVAICLRSIAVIDLEKLFPRKQYDAADLFDSAVISAPKLDPLSRNFAEEWSEIEMINSYKKVKLQKQKSKQSGLLVYQSDNARAAQDVVSDAQFVLDVQVSDEEKDFFDVDKLADTGVKKLTAGRTIRTFNKRFKSFYNSSSVKVMNSPSNSLPHNEENPIERKDDNDKLDIEPAASSSQHLVGVPRVLKANPVRTSKWRSGINISPNTRPQNVGLTSLADEDSGSSGDTGTNDNDNLEDSAEVATLLKVQVETPALDSSIKVLTEVEGLKISDDNDEDGDVLKKEGIRDDETNFNVKKAVFQQSRLRSASIRNTIRGRTKVLNPSIIAFENKVYSSDPSKEDELRRTNGVSEKENGNSVVEKTVQSTPIKSNEEAINKMWAKSTNSIRTPYSIRRQQTLLRVSSQATEGTSKNPTGRKSFSPAPNFAAQALSMEDIEDNVTLTTPEALAISFVNIEDTEHIQENRHAAAAGGGVAGAARSSDSSSVGSATDESSDNEAY